MPHALNKRAIKMRKLGDDAEITPDQRLIAAAPEMLDVLETIENDDSSIPEWLYERIKIVIAKAKGGAA